MNQKVVSWISLVLGFKVGLLVTFLFTVTILNEFFDKPWDVFWGTLNSIAGALIGSLLGGLIAYLISIKQTKFQSELVEQNQKKAQHTLAERIKNEVQNNLSAVSKLHSLLVESKGDFQELSDAIAKGNIEVIEGILIYTNQIEINLTLQLRSNLIDLDYISLHKRIDWLEQIKNSGELLQKQKVPDYITITLKRLLKLTEQFIDTTY
jgi:uncharacterized membrane-anchored protein YhcB (DUF1043 family)